MNTSFRWVACLATASALSGCGDDNSVAPDTTDTQSTVTTFVAAADATVRSSTPDEADGTSPALMVGTGIELFVRFDISSLPEDAVIRTATLRLVAFSTGGATDLMVHYVGSDGWEEETLTDGTKPGVSGDPLGEISLPTSVSRDTGVDLTSGLLAATGQHESFALNRMVSLKLTSNGSVQLRSREAPVTVRPRLELTYDMGTSVELEPVADAWVRRSSPDINYGADETFHVERTDEHAFLRFDLGGVPAGATIGGVTLTAHTYSGFAYGGDGNVYTRFVSDDSWSETDITWTNQPAADEDYLGHWWLWYDRTPSDKTGRNSAIELVPVVQTEVRGDRDLSIRLHSPGYATDYRSREYADVTQRPTLRVLFAAR